jgi:predicted membrane channel-forming protein YqfA (hemolysin III family)
MQLRVELLRFNHAIWHFLVLVGSGCHVIAISLNVIPH